MIMCLSFAADELQAHRNKAIELDEQLSKLTFDFSSIKERQLSILKHYKIERNDSWRSWSLFNDKSREIHMKLLKARIRGISNENLVDYVLFLKKELVYAHAKNGTNYTSALNKMFTNLMDSLDGKVRSLLKEILDQLQQMEKIEQISGWSRIAR